MPHFFVLIVGLFLLAIAVTLVVRALVIPAGPSTETIEQITMTRARGSAPAWTTSRHRRVAT